MLKLPDTIEEWTALTMAWNYPANIDFYDLMSPDGVWNSYNDEACREARRRVYTWLNRNFDWLLKYQIVHVDRVVNSEIKLCTDNYIITGGRMSIMMINLKVLLAGEENRIGRYLSEHGYIA